MRKDETTHSIGERHSTTDAGVRATRAIDCGDTIRAAEPPAHREQGAALAHAAFALARSGPKFGSSSHSFGEQHQAI